MFRKASGPVALLSNRSQFISNVFKLVVGSGIAQAITIILSPVLSRLYTPVDFGDFTFFISIVGLLALIATLRYELAIILCREEQDSAGMVSLSLITAGVFSSCLMAGVIGYKLFFSKIFPLNSHLSNWLFLLPVLVFLIAVANILQNVLIRAKKFRDLSTGRIVNSAVINLSTLLLGIMAAGAWGLIIGNFTGTLLFVIALGLLVYGRNPSLFRIRGTYNRRKLAKIYRDLPVSNTPQVLLEALQNFGIIYLIKIFFSSTMVGLYAQTLRVFQAPLWLLGNAIAQVYMKDASEKFNKKENISDLLMKTIKIGALVGLPVLIILLAFGPRLFGFVFGLKWIDSGTYARILAPWMFFDFIRYCIAQSPIIMGHTRKMFQISVFGNLLMVTCFCIGAIIFHNIIASFLILSIFMSAYSIGVIVWIYKIVKGV